MAQVAITRVAPNYPSTSTQVWGVETQVGSNLICGENINPGTPCYIKSDGLVYMSGGSGVAAITDAGSNVHGWTPDRCFYAQGDSITLLDGIDFGYSTGLTPGQSYYIDISTATKGLLNTSQGFAKLPPCAHAIDDTRIRTFKSLPYA